MHVSVAVEPVPPPQDGPGGQPMDTSLRIRVAIPRGPCDQDTVAHLTVVQARALIAMLEAGITACEGPAK